MPQQTLAERQISAGRYHAESVLSMQDMLAAGGDAATMYAAGFIGGARDHLVKRLGAALAYEIVQTLADEILTPKLTLDQLETEIGEMVFKLRKAATK